MCVNPWNGSSQAYRGLLADIQFIIKSLRPYWEFHSQIVRRNLTLLPRWQSWLHYKPPQNWQLRTTRAAHYLHFEQTDYLQVSMSRSSSNPKTVKHYFLRVSEEFTFLCQLIISTIDHLLLPRIDPCTIFRIIYPAWSKVRLIHRNIIENV